MAIYTGYFDESSDEEQPYFVVGGMILDADDAPNFDREWRDAIKGLPLLDGEPFLHTADFVSGNGQYDPDWKGRYEEKLAILSAVARLISRYSLQTITSSLNMDDYRALDSIIKLSEAVGHPYTVLMRLAYGHMKLWANRNSISTPIKMVVEQRKGFGDLSDMCIISGDPVPVPEPKGLPELQAADYIAWMRLKKYQPNSSFAKVRDSWKEINKGLYTDQPYTFSHLIGTLAGFVAQIPDRDFPLRSEDNTLITFNSNFKNPRKPFKKTALSRRTY